ncbi:MAG: 5'/3'-nucleotidase SurE [Neisseria animaloris]|uniref:5'-nucleotidase SurE n=1 Tax=Neisseria dumasiana TaxID=1931275 RepID=A0A1X3DLE9_9NEIS|nr:MULTISPECIES: 5'/3'-nucleotidase SurE [Neisseria]MDO5073500.1 5'/3'-nucleotidase SurE [Neisseria animaloris]KPN72948.1 stationary phase survival protein SurE [Neisseria sp. 74A18]OSI14246.1 5'/3'-nucleotidase SurE [Neisseria dumasiana]OSI25427.1 5'/3'-nucleotidase SurE [Neisseria dumasiana]OSI29614.1 5'/3'-nucleotidase SurE [Neisseria dumasiana]
MNILICNDDGYLSPGIAILARVAAEFANVRVVAPERDRSGVSNSLTLDRPLRIREADNGFYYVSGTPTDCIHLALHALPEFQPDLVLSGINNGANMGDDTLYSGTVAAATEAYLLGIPAVAFSLNDFSGRYWETAERAAWIMLEHLLKNPPKQPILWNVNIPAVAPEDIQGCKITRLGKRHHVQSIVPARNPRGESVYWIGPIGDISDRNGGTDFAESEAGYITVTPLQIDLTDYEKMDQVADFWQGVMP